MGLSSGVYSLIGVGVGAAATGGMQYAMAARAERREVRAAKRLVTTALLDAIQAYDALLEDRTVEQRYIDTLDAASEVWGQHAAALAGNMPDDDAFDLFAQAFRLARYASGGLRRLDEGDDFPIEPVVSSRRLAHRALHSVSRRWAATLPHITFVEASEDPAPPAPAEQDEPHEP